MYRKFLSVGSLLSGASKQVSIYKPKSSFLLNPLMNNVMNSMQVAHMGTMGSQKKKTNMKAVKLAKETQVVQKDAEGNPILVSVEDLATSIDTKLTPEQFAYAQQMRKKLYGNSRERSLYRAVPKADEVEGTGNFLPLIAPNAEALINYALSQVPKRAGPRRSREKRRMEMRREQAAANRKLKKEQVRAAKIVRWQKVQKDKARAKEYNRQAALLYPPSDNQVNAKAT